MNLAGQTVIQFADYGGPYGGNFIASLLALESKLRECGARQVWVFSNVALGRAWLGALENPRRSMYFVDKSKGMWGLASEVERMAIRERGAILHSHFTTFDVPVLLAWLRLGLRRDTARPVWHVHSPFVRERTALRRVRDLLKLRVMGRFVPSVVVSHGGLQTLLERGMPRERITVIENGVDLERATRSSQSREALRRELAIPSTAAVILMFGWDPQRKGVDLAVQAVRRLLSTTSDVVLLIVGQDRLRSFLNREFRLDLPWIRVAEPRETVADYFQACDVFLSASRAEGFSYAVAEALANGALVISSDIRGLEWAAGTPGVRFFPAEDVGALAACIECFLRLDSDQRERLSLANREFAARYDVRTWAERMIEFYVGL